jgi:hypothetical protein
MIILTVDCELITGYRRDGRLTNVLRLRQILPQIVLMHIFLSFSEKVNLSNFVHTFYQKTVYFLIYSEVRNFLNIRNALLGRFHDLWRGFRFILNLR